MASEQHQITCRVPCAALNENVLGSVIILI